MRLLFLPAVVCLFGAGAARPASAQLPLRDALAIADRSAYANRIAEGSLRAQEGQSLAALRAVLPNVRFEAGYLRTTDPIGSFSTTLRQRTITSADFDPTRLNHPDAIGGYQTGIVLEQPILDPAGWLGRRSALSAERAARSSTEWTHLSTRADVVRAYYGAVLAREHATTMESAVRAARAHLHRAESLVRNGMATKSDALLAAVRVGELETQLLEARGTALTAEHELRLVLGDPDRDDTIVPASLPSADRIREVVSGDTARTLGARADVDAALEAFEAEDAARQRAKAGYLPRIDGFARYDWSSAAQLYGGEKSWTWGIVATFTPFSGASRIAEVQSASGRRAAAEASAAAARSRARLEAERARIAMGVALARLTTAERAAAQSAEALRIVARKYDGGLATILELLEAQSVETRSALALAQSRFGAIDAAANVRLVTGGDPATLVALDEPATNVAAIAHQPSEIP